MPDVDSTLRQIAQWENIIATDLTSAFYQIPLVRECMKYCGVATPFRVAYVSMFVQPCGCQGQKPLLRNSCTEPQKSCCEIALLYYRPYTIQAYVYQPRTLSSTHIQPTILGWVLSKGKLQASPHRVSTLASCTPPKKVIVVWNRL